MDRSASPSSAHNLAALLVASAQRHPARPAIALGALAGLDYAALAARVAGLAATLSAALAPGDRVAVVAQNCPEYIDALFACWQAGLCAVPVNSKLHPRELAYVLGHSDARWAFVDASWRALLAERSSEAPALERVVELGSVEYAALLGESRRDEPAVGSPGTELEFAL